MTLNVIADDLTGACDVAAELATAGFIARVTVDGDRSIEAAGEAPGLVRVLNTQSRGLSAGQARERVLRVVGLRPATVLMKKIDTALRGHLGAELDAAVAGLGARLAFILPAIPAAGRLTRAGCQWFGGRLLASTEFADDPEGAGAESSVAAVLARESKRRTAVVGRSVVVAGEFDGRVRGLVRDGVEFVVVDAESDADLADAVAAILKLEPPLCLAGSTALACALARHLTEREGGGQEGTAMRSTSVTLGNKQGGSALIVCGSLHSTARKQVAGVVAAGLAVAVAVPSSGAASAVSAAATTARNAIEAGRNVVISAGAPDATPDLAGRRETERVVGKFSREIMAGASAVTTLVLIGGETSYAVLKCLGATEIAVHGRFAPLVARGEILDGTAAGTTLVTKGGSGGAADTLVALLASTQARAAAAKQSISG